MDNIKLLGSPRSPFVRICRIFLQKYKIPFHFEVINFVDDQKDAQELAKRSPINRVPILDFNGQQIFDSRVIMNFLIKNYNLPALTIEDENRISSVYSCLDTGVALFLMRRDGIDIQSNGFFMSRHRQRIPENLKYLESWARETKSWYYPEMSLYSFLFWASKRDLLNLSEYPVFVDFLKRFEHLAEVKDTGF